jgi:N-glycosylase/DNA lyase
VVKTTHPLDNRKSQSSTRKKNTKIKRYKKTLKLVNVRLVHTISTEQEPKTLLIPLKTMKLAERTIINLKKKYTVLILIREILKKKTS